MILNKLKGLFKRAPKTSTEEVLEAIKEKIREVRNSEATVGMVSTFTPNGLECEFFIELETTSLQSLITLTQGREYWRVYLNNELQLQISVNAEPGYIAVRILRLVLENAARIVKIRRGHTPILKKDIEEAWKSTKPGESAYLYALQLLADVGPEYWDDIHLEKLAGNKLPTPDVDRLEASGFLVHRILLEGITISYVLFVMTVKTFYVFVLNREERAVYLTSTTTDGETELHQTKLSIQDIQDLFNGSANAVIQ